MEREAAKKDGILGCGSDVWVYTGEGHAVPRSTDQVVVDVLESFKVYRGH
jgi:hypothetical protein